MRLKAAIEGRLDQQMAEEYAVVERGVTRGVQSAARAAQAELRAQVTRGGLGNRLAKAWRIKNYPARGVSAGAAAVVFTKAPKLVRAFSDNTEISSKDGFYLAIPTENAPKRGVGKGRISPSNWPVDRYGPLRFVYRPGKPSLLVVDGLRASYSRKTGKQTGFRRNLSKRGGNVSQRIEGSVTVVMFILVRKVRLKKRLDVEPVARKAEARLSARISRAIEVEGRKFDNRI